MPRTSKPAKKSSTSTSVIFQFKITLLEIRPPIWRRIQIPDGTLVTLHHHIQDAMGWENMHLHQFEIDGEPYGDAQFLNNGWGDEVLDAKKIKLSKLLADKDKNFRFFYEYDFGDGWRHEILYEGVQEAEPKRKYPLCLEGARACPPEDVGGPWGYENFVVATKDPKHEEHEELREWFGGKYNPEAFDAEAVTKRMGKR
jgi:hypothetical protein